MSTGDSVDDLAAALFAAARQERPRDDVRARVLEAMSSPFEGADEPLVDDLLESPATPVLELERRSKYGVALAVAALLAALVGGVVLFRGRTGPVFSIGPERSAAQDDLAPPPEPPSDKEPTPAPPSPVAPLEKPARARAAARASQDGSAAKKVEALPPPSLPDEIAALDRVRTALGRGDTASALGGLDEYERVLKGTRLTAEATMLRIDALARSGRVAEASSLAAKFVEANPGNALAERARAFVRTQRTSGVDAGG